MVKKWRTVGTESFLGVKGPGRSFGHPTPSSSQNKDSEELWIYSPLWVFLTCSKVKFYLYLYQKSHDTRCLKWCVQFQVTCVSPCTSACVSPCTTVSVIQSVYQRRWPVLPVIMTQNGENMTFLRTLSFLCTQIYIWLKYPCGDGGGTAYNVWIRKTN